MASTASVADSAIARNAPRDAFHGCHAGTVTPGLPSDISIPPSLLPADGRFGCGPSKVRPEAVRALAEAGSSWLGTSHRQEPVRAVVAVGCATGCATLFGLPDG